MLEYPFLALPLKVFRVFSLVWESFASSGPEISFMCLDRQDPRVSGGKINYHPLVPIQGPSGSCISIKVRSHIHKHALIDLGDSFHPTLHINSHVTDETFPTYRTSQCQPFPWQMIPTLSGTLSSLYRVSM